MVVPFKNEPGIDFSVQENVDRFNEILKEGKRGTWSKYSAIHQW